MLSIAALAATGTEVTVSEVERDAPMVAELLDYFRWLADQDTGIKITVGDIWELFYEGIRVGRVWTEVCEEIGLPIRKDWE